MDVPRMTANLRGDAAVGRRRLLQGGALGIAGLGSVRPARAATTGKSAQNDQRILNYLLNIEYLQAEYVLRGTVGQSLTAAQITGLGTQGTVTAPAATLVSFQTQALAYYFIGIAADENQHVNVLRTLLGGSAAAEPDIDLVNGFAGFMAAAGLGSGFNPFASELDFLIGAYILKDLALAAYAGIGYALQTAADIGTASFLPTVNNLLAAEGYHSGAIRGYLADIGGNAVTDAISAYRASLSGSVDKGTGGDSNPFDITNVDDYGTANALQVTQVLSELFGTSDASATGGLFFPSGLNFGT